MSLEIRKGGSLIKIEWDSNLGEYKDVSVTENSIRHLYEVCTIKEGASLRDLFLIINTNIDLFDLIIGNWCKEIVSEALVSSPKHVGNYDPEAIEFLELYKHFEKDEESLEGGTYPCFHGIGFILEEDKLNQFNSIEYKKGDRIKWGLSLSRVEDLIDLPLKLNKKLLIYEGNVKAKNYYEVLIEIPGPQYSFGEIVYGVLYELSFHGSPKMRAEFASELQKRVNDIESGKAKLVPFKFDE